MAKNLNDNRIAGTASFTVRADLDAHTAARRIFTTLTGSAAPPAVAAAVFRGSHWVAVTGVVFDGDATGEQTKILGFFINNPEPKTPFRTVPGSAFSAAPPHVASDACGMVPPRGESAFGSGHTFVAMFEWFNFYWNEPSVLGQTQDQRFVTVPADGGTEPALRGVPAIEEPHAPAAAGGTADAINAALDGIATYKLDAPGSPLAALISNAGADPIVLTVQQIPRNLGIIGASERYNIVRLVVNGTHVGNVRIGAQDGRFLSVQAPPASIPGPATLAQFAMAALQRFQRDSPGALDGGTFTERDVNAQLVWRPALQSMSPFYPFVQINVAGGPLFATLDGGVLDKLEDHPQTSG